MRNLKCKLRLGDASLGINFGDRFSPRWGTERERESQDGYIPRSSALERWKVRIVPEIGTKAVGKFDQALQATLAAGPLQAR